MGQFDVNFRPKTTIKGQALANFIAEFTYTSTTEVAGLTNGVEVAKAIEEREKEDSGHTSGDIIVDPLCRWRF